MGAQNRRLCRAAVSSPSQLGLPSKQPLRQRGASSRLACAPGWQIGASCRPARPPARAPSAALFSTTTPRASPAENMSSRPASPSTWCLAFQWYRVTKCLGQCVPLTNSDTNSWCRAKSSAGSGSTCTDTIRIGGGGGCVWGASHRGSPPVRAWRAGWPGGSLDAGAGTRAFLSRAAALLLHGLAPPPAQRPTRAARPTGPAQFRGRAPALRGVPAPASRASAVGHLRGGAPRGGRWSGGRGAAPAAVVRGSSLRRLAHPRS